jgi:AcrR family transcriptional regulator
MVSQQRRAGGQRTASHGRERREAEGSSRARLLDAAAQEFAARGFDGAKVDRIAARARVNKAMLYYHFRNKAALYGEILRDTFGAVADAGESLPTDEQAPEDQLRAFVAAVAQNALSRPHFPPIWLRELAEGGRHLDDAIVSEILRVLRRLGAIVAEGRRVGRFRDVHPLILQMSLVAPLLLFAASGPVRSRFKHRVPDGEQAVTFPALIAYVQEAALAALRRPEATAPPAAGVRLRRRHT